MSGLQWIKKVSVFLISLFNITMRKRILDYNQFQMCFQKIQCFEKELLTEIN